MELLDLVSSDDKVIGCMSREEIYEKELRNFRTINAFVVNEKQELWIPKRCYKKSLNPGCLDASVGGHVKSGENYDEAFFRETLEEINIDLKFCKWKYITKLNPYQHDTTSFMQVYLIYKNQDIQFNQEDYIDFFWGTLEQISQKLAFGILAKRDLSILVKHLKIFS